MTYSEFCHELPVLYGQMTMNNKSKIGSFKADWHPLANNKGYSYYTENGNKGQGGFTLMKAYKLFINNRLSLNPEHGKEASYV